jgi:hypothetical protein
MIKMETLQRYNDSNGVRPIVQMSQDNRSIAMVQEILFQPKNHQQSGEIKEHENPRIVDADRSGTSSLQRYNNRPAIMSQQNGPNGPCVPLSQEMIFHTKNLQPSEMKEQEPHRIPSGVRPGTIMPQDMIFPPKKLYS